MKNYKKIFLGFVFSFFLVFGFSSVAMASTLYNYSYAGGSGSVDSSAINKACFNHGMMLDMSYCNAGFVTPTTNGVYTFHGYSGPDGTGTETEGPAHEQQVTISGFSVTPPPTGGTFEGIKFFEQNPETSKSTAFDLTAQAETATTTTTKGLLPIIAVVGGVILGIIGIRFIVSTMHETGNKKTKI